MRALLQRVTKASVTVSGETVGSIDQGLLVFLGVGEDDTQEDIDWLVRKIVNMRIFSDENGHMNRSVIDIKGAILVVSQFTLHASTKKGNRPSFIRAAAPDVANTMYETTVNQLRTEILGEVATGVFGAMMEVSLLNDGPVTIWIDSKNRE